MNLMAANPPRPLRDRSARSARAAWARSGAPATRASVARWRSRCCPTAFAADPERLARFEREAQLLASLNHPQHRRVYGLEEVGRPAARWCMELVEGEDLAERLARGPMPLAEALAIARQIAEALEPAHEHGIVHRDLKPGEHQGHARGRR